MAVSGAQSMNVLDVLSEKAHVFLQPTSELYNSTIQLAKQFLDPLANNVTEAQLQRQKLERQSRKRKRGKRRGNLPGDPQELLRMRQIYTDGFGVEQIWQQARRVLDATAAEVELDVPDAAQDLYHDEKLVDDDAESRGPGETEGSEDGLDGSLGPDEDDDSLGEEGLDWELDEDEKSAEDAPPSKRPKSILKKQSVNGIHPSTDRRSVSNGDDSPLDEESNGQQADEEFVKDRNGLNDGFFSIDDFNKKSQFLENQDARGDPDDGAASDEEEVDWGTNPFEAGAPLALGNSKEDQRRPARGKRNRDALEEADDDQDGPTFSDADLDGIGEDTDDDLDNEDDAGNDAMNLDGDFSNTNDIFYRDFFAPPARQKGQLGGRHMRRPKARSLTPPHATTDRPELAPEKKLEDLAGAELDSSDPELRRAISSVRRDLYDDEDEEDEGAEGLDDDVSDSDAEADNDASGPNRTKVVSSSKIAPKDPSKDNTNQNLSTHERTQLALRAEIARLEAENVAAKPWSLAGETVAPARPENALLEEDLEFERAGKPVPVITADVNEDIESLIKRRILARDFDEVLRRRPLDLVTGSTPGKRGLQEDVADTKPKRGLADEYADDYLQRTDPNYMDSRSEALKAKHKDIENHWASVARSLDALSNWNFKPKMPEPSVEVRIDVPLVRMEDARPGGVEGGVEDTALAPQEVYDPSARNRKNREEGLRRTKGGTVVANEEETRESRRRRRRREKERMRKRSGNANPQVNGNAGSKARVIRAKDSGKSKKSEHREVLNQLQKGGVQVIDGKKGLNAPTARNREENATSGVEAKASKTGGTGAAAKYLL